MIYSVYQFTIPYVMFGSNPGPGRRPDDDPDRRQSFSNSLFGFGAAASVLLMGVMLIWVLVWFRAFRRDLEAAA